MDIEREVPLTKEELAAERKRTQDSIRKVYHRAIDVPDSFTCDECGFAPKCTLVFDLYNTNGDCLAEK